MAPETSTDDRVLAYVAGELSKDARRAFEDELARDPALAAEVDGLLALQSMLDDDMHEGLRTGDDEPPPHLVDAIMRAEAFVRPAEIRAAALGQSISARDEDPSKSSLVSRLSSWIFGGGAAILVAGAFVFLVVTKDEASSPATLFEAKNDSAKQEQMAPPSSPAPDDAVSGGAPAADPVAPDPEAQEEAPTDDAQRYSGSPGGGDQRQMQGGGRFADEKKPAEQQKRSRNAFEPPAEAAPISGAKLDAIGTRKGNDSGGDYVIDSPGALVGKAQPRDKAAGEWAESPQAEPVEAQKAGKSASDSSLADEDGERGGLREESRAKERSLEKAAAASSVESEADDLSPRKDAPPPPLTKPAKPLTSSTSVPPSGRASSFGGSAPAASAGPPALSADEGKLLRSARDVELEKSKKKSENKGALPVDQAVTARREIDIEMTFATANSEFARGQFESALATYVEAASIDAGAKVLGALPHVGRMRTLNRLGRFSEALALVPKLKATSTRPEDLAEGYLQAGDAAYALGRLVESENFYTLAKKSPTARARALTGLAAIRDQKRAPAVDAAAPAESK